jgi:hypothetical protein
MPKSSFPMNPMTCWFLDEAWGLFWLTMSGLHAIQIIKLQADKATYLEPKKEMGINIGNMNFDNHEYEHKPSQHTEPVDVMAGADRNNAEGVPSDVRENHPVNGDKAP